MAGMRYRSQMSYCIFFLAIALLKNQLPESVIPIKKYERSAK